MQQRLTPQLSYPDTAAAIEWYGRAFGARERMRLEAPGGGIVHAQIQLGEALLMMLDACPQMPAPDPDRGAPGAYYLLVSDADAAWHRAVEAGAKPLIPVTNTFWGDRCGSVRDPFGYMWTFATKVEEMSPEEMVLAGKAAFNEQVA